MEGAAGSDVRGAGLTLGVQGAAIPCRLWRRATSVVGVQAAARGRWHPGVQGAASFVGDLDRLRAGCGARASAAVGRRRRAGCGARALGAVGRRAGDGRRAAAAIRMAVSG